MPTKLCRRSARAVLGREKGGQRSRGAIPARVTCVVFRGRATFAVSTSSRRLSPAIGRSLMWWNQWNPPARLWWKRRCHSTSGPSYSSPCAGTAARACTPRRLRARCTPRRLRARLVAALAGGRGCRLADGHGWSGLSALASGRGWSVLRILALRGRRLARVRAPALGVLTLDRRLQDPAAVGAKRLGGRGGGIACPACPCRRGQDLDTRQMRRRSGPLRRQQRRRGECRIRHFPGRRHGPVRGRGSWPAARAARPHCRISRREAKGLLGREGRWWGTEESWPPNRPTAAESLGRARRVGSARRRRGRRRRSSRRCTPSARRPIARRARRLRGCLHHGLCRQASRMARQSLSESLHGAFAADALHGVEASLL